MKRKDIKQAINKAKANHAKIREKADFYENVLSFIWQISDKERCDYYDQITLYVMYGIEPNLDTFSDIKRNQFGFIFSLLKKQRIAFEKSRNSSDYDSVSYMVSPQDTPNQTINTITSNNKEVKEKDKTLNTQIDLAVEFFDDFSLGLFGKVVKPLSDQQLKSLHCILEKHDLETFKTTIIMATQSDFLKGGGSNGWVMTFDWFIVPDNFEKVLNGNYNKNKSNNLKTHNDEYYPTI